ncbi:MAG: pseudouridine-5'-phosphate glycosidase [Fimbriimonadales bacterium]
MIRRVALETAVMTHGLPAPYNEQAGVQMCDAVRQAGGTPVVIGIIEGEPTVGLTEEQMRHLARHPAPQKVALHNLALVCAQRQSGGTTVSATLWLARRAGISVMATGGIGGVHRGDAHDISADLPALARLPMLVVCSGAKVILDLPATREWLETWGIPVVGYQTDELPGFYTAHTGLRVDAVANTVEQIGAFWHAHQHMGTGTAMLVVQPPPAEHAMPAKEVEAMIAQACAEAEAQGIQGAATTPYLLRRLAELSEGRTVPLNLALLKANAHLAGAIATVLED